MGTPIEVPSDVPDADAAEQARETRPDDTPVLPTRLTSDDVDEFDAVEQHIVVEDDEDDYR